MKKSDLLIFLCCLLMSFFGTGIYAQENTQQYSDGEFEFEFQVELVYGDDNDDDDDSDEDDDDDSDSDEDNDDDSDDDSDSDEDDDSDSDDDDDDSDDDDDNQELLGVEITVTNTGNTSIDNDILFRAYVGEEVPETIPDTYHEEGIMNLLDAPLESGNSEDIFLDIDLTQKRGGGRVIIIWPLVDANKSKTNQDAPFIVIRIPNTETKNKLNLNDFSNVNIYPNPTRNILNVDMPEHTPSNQITIYDKTGQAIKTFDEIASGLNVLNLDGLLPGIYFAAIRNENGQTIHHIKIAIR